MPLVGHQHQIDIQELTDKGDGKGRLFDRPLFVEGLLPGEQALVELTEVKPNYLHGKLVELTQPSADRVPDFCPNTECGGCQVRPLAYPAQLKLKQSLVQSALEQVGLGETQVNRILGMDSPFAYRNKAQYAVRGSEAGGRNRLLPQALP